MKLYIYDHCPYCLKARMIFGLKNIPVELHVLLNDDAETPTRMVGQKQVPILQKDDSRYMPESMDIVHYVDKLDGKPLLTGKRSPAIEEWLRKVNGYANKLLLPRFAKSAFDEFSTPAARKYFVDKKEASAGNFADLLAHSDGLIKNISDDLRALDKLIVKPNAVNGELSEDDIQLFPLLRNLTLVAGINLLAALLITAIIWRNRHKSICYHQWRFNPDPPRQPVFAGCRRFQFFLLASLSLVTHAALCQDIDADFMSRTTMNKFLFAAALIVSGLLVGCNQLTQYTITEQEINQSLAKHNNFSKDIGLPGVADAHIVLTNLTSQIGREEPNKVTLTGDANLDMNSLFGSQKATMKLKLKALPVFDKEKGAIFLKEMEVVDATVQPEKMQTVMQTLLPYLNQALRNYFNQQPAYVLREDGSQGEAMAKKLAKGIEVKPGEIVIPFTD